MNITISIIVPIYNTEPYLQRCIDSILHQTYRNLEIILVNDGSSDACPRICDEYSLKDNRIKVIHKNNGGLSSARNAGIDIATGQYIGFVDSDDFIEDDMYGALLSACLKNNAEISMCGRYYVREGKAIPHFTLPNQVIWNNKNAIKNLLMWNNIDSSACDKLFKNALFEGVRFPQGLITEDIFIIPEIIDKANSIIHIGKPKYYYCVRENSISTGVFTKQKMDVVISHKKVADYVMKKYPEYKEYADYFFYHAVSSIIIRVYNEKVLKHEPDVYYQTIRLLKNHYFSMIQNKYVPIITKIHLSLIYIKLYYPAQYIYSTIQGIFTPKSNVS